MRFYEVRPGDSPASIAAREDMAGCPKCAIDLVRANPHKPTVVHPNGFTTFRDLTVGEKLKLPDKWFDGSLDTRPHAYFAALPYADGVTPSTLGDSAAGVLGDYSTLDAAAAQVDALAQMNDQEFSNAVDSASVLIDQSVNEAYKGANTAAAGYAQDARAGAYWARQRGLQMAAAVEAGDMSAAAALRPEIQSVLSTAMGSARLALQEFHGGGTAQPATSFSATVVAAAQAAAAAIAADGDYCTSVAHPGSAVNSAVHAFKTAWNASQSPPVPINTSNYEQAVSDALTRVLGAAPTACAAHAAPSLPQPPVPITPVSFPVAVTPPRESRLSTGAIVGMSVLGAGAVGGAIYLATRQLARGHRRPRVRRVRGLP